jgi:hypothetical protein
MNRSILRMDGFLRRLEWVAWLVLILSLGLGLGQEIGSAPAGTNVGSGYWALDVAMTVLIFAAAGVQCWVQLRYPEHGTRLQRVARWLMFGVSTVFAFRFAWMLHTLGDIYAPPITVAAFSVYAIAQMMHGIAIVGLHK